MPASKPEYSTGVLNDFLVNSCYFAGMNRRVFLKTGALAIPAIQIAQQGRPQLTDGVQVGDVLRNRAVIWARADRESRLVVEYSTTEGFLDSRRVEGPNATTRSDFTARLDLQSLPPDQTIFFRAFFERGRTVGQPVSGSFRTAPDSRRDVRFLWASDTVGQGFGINPDLGGMRIYETMRRARPDFFVHSGDTIYADGPVPSEMSLNDGSTWRNLTTEAKSKVAETLAEFRGNYRYNLMDSNLRSFNSEVPQIWQWDDHEVTNNWSSGKNLRDDARYKVKSISTLSQRARQAFMEYSPVRFDPARPRIYRRIPYGPLLDVFVMDLRSYRAANSYNRQLRENSATAFIGAEQMRWLQQDLKASTAVWKVMACDMPIGLMVGDGRDAENRSQFDNGANGDGHPLGRELEIARLLGFIKQNRLRNVVWICGDVHYTAAHFYDPAKAQFKDFDPFWEFVSGPLNAGTYGPNSPDNTFGLQVVYQKSQRQSPNDNSPKAGLQFFGEVVLEGRTENLTVNLRDVAGATLFSKTLEAQRERN
jgi:alkaline phosphatase D